MLTAELCGLTYKTIAKNGVLGEQRMHNYEHVRGQFRPGYIKGDAHVGVLCFDSV
jgi:hypothetical protein